MKHKSNKQRRGPSSPLEEELMKKTKAFAQTDFDPAEAPQRDSKGRMGQLTALPALFRRKARTAAAICGGGGDIIALVAVLMSVALFSGCQGGESVRAVGGTGLQFFSSLTKYDVPVDGSVKTISANQSETLFVLARRADLRQAKPAHCKVNGQYM